jgi:hypothetical protein
VGHQPRTDHGPIHVGSVVHAVALEQVFSPKYFGFPLSVSFHKFFILSTFTATDNVAKTGNLPIKAMDTLFGNWGKINQEKHFHCCNILIIRNARINNLHMLTGGHGALVICNVNIFSSNNQRRRNCQRCSLTRLKR